METIRVPINKPFFGEEEAKEAYKLVVAGALTSSAHDGGPKVREFEAALATYLKCKDVVVVNSGTSALIASLMAAEIKAGDEVIIPSFTFAATANAVKAVGAVPVFADIQLSDYCVDVADVKRKVTKKTKAVIPVNLYGGMADVAALRDFLDRESISVVEDAAQSLGSTQDGVFSGTMGAMDASPSTPAR